MKSKLGNDRGLIEVLYLYVERLSSCKKQVLTFCAPSEIQTRLHVRKVSAGVNLNSMWNRGTGATYCNAMFVSFFTYLLTYLLTYSMVQSPSSEANWFAASQEIPCISRNPKAHYRTHKRPPPVSILGQPNPVHIPTSHLLEIHPLSLYAARCFP